MGSVNEPSYGTGLGGEYPTVVLAAGLISLGIEAVQGLLITGRTFDIDDVILNTVGAALAYLLVGRRFARRAHPR